MAFGGRRRTLADNGKSQGLLPWGPVPCGPVPPGVFPRGLAS